MTLPILDPQSTPSHPWYAKGLSFQCTCCGNCCSGGPGYVWISDAEIEALADHLGLTAKQTMEKYCRRMGRRISLKERRNAQGNYDCIFLKELPPDPALVAAGGKVAHRQRVCGIYQARPTQCRTWPFWPGNLASKEQWDRAAGRCPGMNRGQHYDREEIEQRKQATARADEER